ncbi:MAG: alpha-glucan family phosphorylase [Anaerolineae bacterium]|nr:alpha-glucan family phosphorylase [Anaerolineae bacterium]
MKPINTFTVIPALPEPLKPLRTVAYNLHWAWDHETIELFLRLDSDLWEETHHNPIEMLGKIDQHRLEEVVEDVGFMAHLERVTHKLNTYMTQDSTWFSRMHSEEHDLLVAYFSAEFGVTECLSIFAGGLGVLAGDHLKSASDLGVPLIGVGLLYQQGYFRQYLNHAGWQQEAYEDNDFHNLPIRLAYRDGEPLKIAVKYPGRKVYARVWIAQVGRVELYLLDTNIDDNQRPEDRDITDQLYGGDEEMRIKQEIMLGIGGYRALQGLELKPAIYHINEGHSAFLALEHLHNLMTQHGISLEEARELASANLVFTTHTPVPAGHDYFSQDLMERYLGSYLHKLGISLYDFMAFGRRNPHDESEPFCMTILALKMASYSNGVSKLHGEVSREMWRDLWPNVPDSEIPITHVTNGVHFPSWISREMNRLYDRYLGPGWREVPADPVRWSRAEGIAPEELWRTHERRRERLVAFIRRRLKSQLKRRGASQWEIEAATEVLDPEALTIGFARRFATYKRATLLLRDPERLAELLNAPGRPVQIIFAGKAHPKDDPGKALIQEIVGFARQEKFRSRLVFIEDYDMAVSRYMVEGVDIWLNTPQRPREASGTSGMKALANGVLNLSILDGWWAEAYEPGLGWAIGSGEIYEDHDYQDQIEADALYQILEREVVPIFYELSSDGLPRRWLSMVYNSIGKLCYYFNTNRMVREYTDRFYIPSVKRYHQLASGDHTRASALAAWRHRIRQAWPQVRVEAVETNSLTEIVLGEEILAQARVYLGALTAAEVSVEFYMGLVDSNGDLTNARSVPMQCAATESPGVYSCVVNVPACCTSGLHGYTVRILPKQEDLVTPFIPGYIVWA